MAQALFKIKVHGSGATATRTELAAGRHRLTVDEPASRGGTDFAASPLETMLAAFLACTNVIANVAAGDLGLEIESMELELTGHFDNRGVFAKAPVTVPFPRIDLAVTVTTEASEAEVQALGRAVAERCPISVILRQAGTDVRDTWRRAGARRQGR